MHVHHLPSFLLSDPPADDPRSMTSQMNIDTTKWASDLATRYEEYVIMVVTSPSIDCLRVYGFAFYCFRFTVYVGRNSETTYLAVVTFRLTSVHRHFPVPSRVAGPGKVWRTGLGYGVGMLGPSFWITFRCMQCCYFLLAKEGRFQNLYSRKHTSP